MDKQTKAPGAPERIAKRLARTGLCSRREAERWIEAGRVAIDGEVISSPAVNVTEKSQIVVDGKALAEKEPTRLWRYHKPAGLVTTHKDPEGRPTLFEKLPKELPRVISVGRLDLTSEGLILLTNDGGLARQLELPSTGWLRRYRVRVHGEVTEGKLEKMMKGIEIDGEKLKAEKVELDRTQGANAWISMGLREGKNREIRRLCEAVNLQVTRLIRISYGPFQLGALPKGEVDEVARSVLREQLGIGGDRLLPSEKRLPGDKRAAEQRAAAGKRPARAKPRPSGKPSSGAKPDRGPRPPVPRSKRPPRKTAP